MSTLKGLNQLNTYINKWLSRNDFDCSAKIDTEFYYDSIKNKIGYAIAESENQIKCFADYCNQLGLAHSLEYFTLAFFHELGHNETLDIVSDAEYNKSLKEKAKLNKLKVITDKDKYKYYNLPIEQIATQWAVDYINDNIAKIKDFETNVFYLIQKIYELNGVTE